MSSEPDLLRPIEYYKWEILLNEIFDNSSIDGSDISLKLMKPILYHFYCISCIQGPDTNYEIEVDHIIPQSLFTESTIARKEILKDNLLNLGLLPKNENISKGRKKLIQIDQQWLKDQILKYEFIKEEDYVFYSNINNYQEIFKNRKSYFEAAFKDKRNSSLNN